MLFNPAEAIVLNVRLLNVFAPEIANVDADADVLVKDTL
jgi:hypothetical protein